MNFIKRPAARYLLFTVLLDALFFGLTDPAKVAPLWLIAGFLLAIATMYWFFRGLMAVLSVYFKAVRKQEKQLTLVFSIIAAILLGMQSMGQLSLRDMLVLAPLVILGYFYIRYNHRNEIRN